MNYRFFIGLSYIDKANALQTHSPEIVLKLLSQHFMNFTATIATGYYNNQPEPTMIVDIIGTANTQKLMREILKDFANILKQECILLQAYDNVYNELIFGLNNKVE